jgi:hypothetical protein
MRWGLELVEPSFDDGNFGVDLMDQQTEIEAGPSLQMNRQFLPVRPEIFERLAVVQLNIRAHSFPNCIRYEDLLRTKKLTCKRAGLILADTLDSPVIGAGSQSPRQRS